MNVDIKKRLTERAVKSGYSKNLIDIIIKTFCSHFQCGMTVQQAYCQTSIDYNLSQ